MNVNDDDDVVVVVVVAYRRQFDFIKIFCLKEMIHCEIYNMFVLENIGTVVIIGLMEVSHLYICHSVYCSEKSMKL